jgi:hypothetical protein
VRARAYFLYILKKDMFLIKLGKEDRLISAKIDITGGRRGKISNAT